ncbi:HlyD family secretion protein [Anatilimnocola floriformis]|uniref:HlyD family secretion protein n=1 Tax=Anatilimnocola floriformis TaxID=2948575 RepID=UPI0020C47121|nr:HlyD family efflux transporter periplasmic adaptor subunit [Anatilimnocola floriformis]
MATTVINIPVGSQAITQWKSMQLMKPLFSTRLLASVILVALVGTILAMLFVPWQQTSRGAGRVIAYHPTERPQTVEAPIDGRVARWGENIVEGTRVAKGDFILEIADNDNSRDVRLQQQVEAAMQKLAFATEKVGSYHSQIEEYRQANKLVIESYAQLVAVGEQKIQAAEADLAAAKAAEWQLELDYQRQSTLANEGLVGVVKAQEAKAKYDQAVSKRRAAENYVAASINDRRAKLAEGESKAREAVTKVQEAAAKHQNAQGEESLARKDLAEIQGKTAEFGQRRVAAPRDGILYRILVSDNAQMLKKGAPLFTIVPETSQQAVELWVNGNDVPLVQLGREVRLQFEGWPAVQFAGWPSVAVGTFGGEVIAVDATDDGRGKFRVLVRPGADQDWPSVTYLRQGARANGWVLLNEVTLGFELWRQLNGFPPAASYSDKGSDDSGDDEKEKKKVKLPK